MNEASLQAAEALQHVEYAGPGGLSELLVRLLEPQKHSLRRCAGAELFGKDSSMLVHAYGKLATIQMVSG